MKMKMKINFPIINKSNKFSNLKSVSDVADGSIAKLIMKMK